MGAMRLHGPHHSAQKSTSTGLSAEAMTSVKLAWVRVLMASAMVISLGDSEQYNRMRGREIPAGSGVVRLRLEPPLGVDGRHAARAGCGDGLAIGVVLDIAAGEHAVDVGGGARPGDEVAVVLHVEDALEQVGV